jgi:hypothetical protein
MESNTPLGSIIGFDAASLGAAANRGRRSTDPGNETFAQVYDLAAYANSGSRKAALVEMPQPAAPVATAPAPLPAPLSVHAPSLEPVDRAAADRLYLHLTTGGSWLRVTDDHSGTVVMRLHDAAGAPVRELSITELAGADGPEVA